MKHHLNADVQPCPCCGYRSEIEQVPDDPLDENSGGYYIECKRAGCGITTRLAFASMDDPVPGLVQSWNRRTARPEAAQKMWLVEFDGQPQAAYPRMVQAEVYASGFSRAAKIIEGTFAVSPPLHKEKP